MKCNLCGSRNYRKDPKQDRYGHLIELATCDCGLSWLHNYWTPETNREFYTSGRYRDLIGLYRGRVFDWVEHYKDQYLYATKLLNWLDPWEIHGATPCHIGADPEKVDPIADTFAMRWGVECDSVDHLEGHRLEGYSHIVLCRTVDHLLDITEAFQQIKQGLTSDGVFYFDILDQGPYSHNFDLKIDHQYYLNDLTAKMYIDRAGFTLVDSTDTIDDNHMGYLCRLS